MTWREQVPTLVHAYNCTRNNATYSSLCYLMFGRQPCLPVDILFGTNTVNLKVTPVLSILKIVNGEYSGHTRLVKKE